MSNKERNLARLKTRGMAAIVRLDSAEQLMAVAQALKVGGADIVEFTMTTPGALEIIARVSQEFGDEVLLGAGTVLDAETARAAILAGAEFIVGPNFDPAVIEICRRYSKIVIPGAFTPTEILRAWQAGADMVKVFPAGEVGPTYVKSILGPLPQVELMPTGGVNLGNVADFIRAGATAVGVGGALVDRKAVAEGRLEVLTERAQQLVQAIADARG